MSKWRRLAIEMFPEHRGDFQRRETSYYHVFFDLGPLLREFHKHDNTAGLTKIYDFAEWSWGQRKRAPDLGNAAGVAFYEHLVDDQITFEAIPYWIKPYIFKDMMGLFKWRLETQPREFDKLVATYNKILGTKFDPKAAKYR